MSRILDVVARALLIALAVTVVDSLYQIVFPSQAVDAEAAGIVGRYVLPLASAFCLAVPLAYPIGRSRLRGTPLLGVVFLAVFGLTTVLSQIESALFLNMTPTELWLGVLQLTLLSVVLSWLAVALYPKSRGETVAAAHPANPQSTASWVRRWLGVSVAYVFLYVTAGLLILPRIRTWYEEQGLLDQNPAVVLPLQIVRGALFVAVVVPLLRSMRVTRWQASLAMAVMIPLVHGVAPLISPNPFMPDYVRHAHMLEIGWSNFVLGLLIGYLFWNPRSSEARAPES